MKEELLENLPLILLILGLLIWGPIFVADSKAERAKAKSQAELRRGNVGLVKKENDPPPNQ